MLPSQSLQLAGAIFVIIGSDFDPDPLDNPDCGTVKMRTNPIQPRIVGGYGATSGNWPWQIAVLDGRKRLMCGGTLINSEFVLTAAHCITKKMYIVAGEYNLAEEEGHEQQRRVVKVMKHPDYNINNVDNDIALLKLDKPLELTQRVWPACLPKQNEELKPEVMATIVGWGAISYTKQANGKPQVERDDVLNQAQVPIVDFDECNSSYGDELESQHVICAGFKQGMIDSCAGDSGGPLMVEKDNRWHVYGITSFGDECGKEGKYGIYSKTSAYIDWIKRTMRRNTSGTRTSLT